MEKLSAMNVRWIGKVPVIDISGRFLGDPETSAFREQVRRLKELGSVHVVVDMHRLDAVGSEGLGTLVSCARTLRAAGGDMRLATLNDRTQNVLVVVAQLDRVFRIYETAEGAAVSY